MTLAQKRFYILEVLNTAYSEFKNRPEKDRLSTDGGIRTLDISSRLSNIQRPIDSDELSMIVQKLVDTNFVFPQKSNILGSTYIITYDGIEEWEKLKKQYQTKADVEREAMRIQDEIAQQISVSMGEPELLSAVTSPSLIFISHSSKNDSIITAFTQQILRLALHIPAAEIFDTSTEETRVRGGDDFKHRIRVELKSAKVVILFITKEYKESEICLNELGATWMLDESVKVIPFILTPVDYSNLGLIHNNTQVFKMDKEEDIMAFVGENKGKDGFISPHYNDAALKIAVKHFLKVIEDYKNADRRTEKERRFAKKQLTNLEKESAPPLNVGPSIESIIRQSKQASPKALQTLIKNESSPEYKAIYEEEFKERRRKLINEHYPFFSS